MPVDAPQVPQDIELQRAGFHALQPTGPYAREVGLGGVCHQVAKERSLRR
jgi:hypothetical protein